MFAMIVLNGNGPLIHKKIEGDIVVFWSFYQLPCQRPKICRKVCCAWHGDTNDAKTDANFDCVLVKAHFFKNDDYGKLTE